LRKKVKLCNGTHAIIYGDYSKEELKEIIKIRNDVIMEAQSKADVKRDEMFKCTYCGGNGCTMCGW
jgi:Cdc6-like AAA superfamily ATPase